jgi:hypothetical protein
MRPIIGVKCDCLWLCGDVCHYPPSISAPRSLSHGKLRRRPTRHRDRSRVKFSFRVPPGEWKPACRVDPLVVVRLVTRYRVEARALKRNLGSTPRLSSLDGHLSLHRSARGAPLGPARSTQVRCTCGSVEHTHTVTQRSVYVVSILRYSRLPCSTQHARVLLSVPVRAGSYQLRAPRTGSAPG